MLLCLITLCVYILIAYFICVILLAFVSLPGSYLEKHGKKHSKKNYILAVIISSVAQTYLYLTYIAFVVHNAYSVIKPQRIESILVWGVAFLSSVLPIFFILKKHMLWEKETGNKDSMVTAFKITMIAAVAGFFIFTVNPSVVNIFWSHSFFKL